MTSHLAPLGMLGLLLVLQVGSLLAQTSANVVYDRVILGGHVMDPESTRSSRWSGESCRSHPASGRSTNRGVPRPYNGRYSASRIVS
jgi:hypothetical protein